jgi:hypothetical protein
MFTRMAANKGFNKIWGIAGKGFNQMGRGVTAARRGWGNMAQAEKLMVGTGVVTGSLGGLALRNSIRKRRAL